AAGASTAGDPDAAITKVPGVSVTARACNPMYDVYHFTVVADVETDKVDDWLRALGKNRLITPLNVELHSLDAAQVEARKYMYGDRPFTTVIVNCEELFLRKWTEPLMPPLIKTQLGITPAGGPTPQAAGEGR